MQLVLVAVWTGCPIVEHYSPHYGLAKPKQNAINYNKRLLLTSSNQSLQKNLKPRPHCTDLNIIPSIQRGQLGLRFSQKDLTLS